MKLLIPESVFINLKALDTKIFEYQGFNLAWIFHDDFQEIILVFADGPNYGRPFYITKEQIESKILPWTPSDFFPITTIKENQLNYWILKSYKVHIYYNNLNFIFKKQLVSWVYNPDYYDNSNDNNYNGYVLIYTSGEYKGNIYNSRVFAKDLIKICPDNYTPHYVKSKINNVFIWILIKC
jgi:hypothetical protein